jgi:hypothetical protein
MSIDILLLGLSLVFLIIHAIRTPFPLWPSVLCLILRSLIGAA